MGAQSWEVSWRKTQGQILFWRDAGGAAGPCWERAVLWGRRGHVPAQRQPLRTAPFSLSPLQELYGRIPVSLGRDAVQRACGTWTRSPDGHQSFPPRQQILQDCTALTTDQQIPPSLDPTAKDNLGNQAVRNKKMCNSFQEVSLPSFCLRGTDSTPGSTHLASYRHSVHRVLRT